MQENTGMNLYLGSSCGARHGKFTWSDRRALKKPNVRGASCFHLQLRVSVSVWIFCAYTCAHNLQRMHSLRDAEAENAFSGLNVRTTMHALYTFYTVLYIWILVSVGSSTAFGLGLRTGTGHCASRITTYFRTPPTCAGEQGPLIVHISRAHQLSSVISHQLCKANLAFGDIDWPCVLLVYTTYLLVPAR